MRGKPTATSFLLKEAGPCSEEVFSFRQGAAGVLPGSEALPPLAGRAEFLQASNFCPSQSFRALVSTPNEAAVIPGGVHSGPETRARRPEHGG